MKTKTLIILFIFLITIIGVTANVQIQYSENNLTGWENVTSVSEPTNNSYQLLLQSDSQYYFRGRNSTSMWYYFEQRTKEGPEGVMASLAITIFILLVSIGVFWLGLSKEIKLAKNAFTNLMLKRSVIIIGIYLMVLNSSIMATIAATVGLNLTNEMFTYMWLFGNLGWLLMFGIAISTFFTLLKMWKFKKEEERDGDDYDEF